MKRITLAATCALIISGVFAQTTKPGIAKTSTTSTDPQTINIDTVSLYLAIPDSIASGSNGAGVAYDPIRKLYYAAFAGNKNFRMVVFDAKGNEVGTSTTMADLRGLWYNPAAKTIEAILYNYQGVIRYALNSKGIPVSYTTLFKDTIQANENSGAAFDAAHNRLIIINEGVISLYDATTGKFIKKVDLTEDNYELTYTELSTTTCLFTGKKGMELGIPNIDDQQVYFIDNSTGKINITVQMPYFTMIEDMFNIAWCNNMIWLFNKDDRQWEGYKMP